MSKIFAALAVALLGLPVAQAEDKHSDAEVLMFETDHLKQITEPTVLQYDFKKDGALESGFEDSVAVNIDKIAEDGKAVSTIFLSGAKKIDFPAIDNAAGNPVLLYFLERDIREMERLTGGKPPYFKKRIRLALADTAEVRPIKFSYEGKEIAGREIRITPYADDPLKERFGKYLGKYYLFTLADEVPGGVYQMRAVIPEAGAEQKKPMIDETLTFSKATQRAAGK